MATQPTNLPVPSESPRDLKFNAGKIDEFVTSVAQKYIDRFGGEHYTIEGLRQLAQQAIAAFGWVLIDSFQDGQTLTLPNQALRWKLPDGDGEYYRWDGAFPKVVPAGSTPESTGGIGAGAWVSIGDAALRTMLASSSGAEMIGHGNTTVGAELDKLNNYLVTVNVKDYGAVGDWNETTQTGTDNTLAFQNAINALANMPDIRNGQVRQLYIPNGNYRIKNIIVPDTYGFMIEFKGDGVINTRLYCYPDSPTTTPCIEINIEYVSFDSIEVLASLKRNASISDRSATLVEVKLPDGRADCDIKLMPTSSFGGAETLFRVYGRGFHCNGAVMFFSGTFLEIACDTRTWTTGGNQSTTGMRNYLINNNRFDTVGIMVKITGNGYQKDHINDLIISGNDIYQMDRLILGADATLQHSIISSNSSVGSFAYNVIEIKRIVNTTISSNRWVKFYNRDSTPSVDSDYMHGMVSCSGSIEKVNIIGNSMSWNTLQVVSIGSASFSLNIVGNTFDQSYMSGTSAVIVRGANCEYLNISNNQFYNSIQPTLSVSAFGSSQTSPSVIYSGNLSSFLISGEYLSYPATLKYGATTVNTTGLRTKYTTVNRVVKASIQFGSSDTTSGGSGDEVSLSLPQNPVVDSGLTSLFSGGGSITFQSGGIPTIIRVLVSPSGGAVFIKLDGTTMKRGDITSSFLLFFDVSYRI